MVKSCALIGGCRADHSLLGPNPTMRPTTMTTSSAASTAPVGKEPVVVSIVRVFVVASLGADVVAGVEVLAKLGEI